MPDLIPKPEADPLNGLAQAKPTGTPPGMSPAMFDEVDETTVLPQEQAQYDQIVNQAMRMIHGERSRDKVLEQINRPEMPVYQAVGRTAAMMAQAITQKAKTSGQELSPDAVWHAGADVIVPEIMIVGVESNIFPFKQDSEEFQTQMEMAFLEGNKVYGEQMLQGPDAQRFSQEAQDFYTEQIALEADEGTLAPGFREGLIGGPEGGQVGEGVRRALTSGS